MRGNFPPYGDRSEGKIGKDNMIIPASADRSEGILIECGGKIGICN